MGRGGRCRDDEARGVVKIGNVVKNGHGGRFFFRSVDSKSNK